jgi:hypothetical protein
LVTTLKEQTSGSSSINMILGAKLDTLVSTYAIIPTHMSSGRRNLDAKSDRNQSLSFTSIGLTLTALGVNIVIS